MAITDRYLSEPLDGKEQKRASNKSAEPVLAAVSLVPFARSPRTNYWPHYCPLDALYHHSVPQVMTIDATRSLHNAVEEKVAPLLLTLPRCERE